MINYENKPNGSTKVNIRNNTEIINANSIYINCALTPFYATVDYQMDVDIHQFNLSATEDVKPIYNHNFLATK